MEPSAKPKPPAPRPDGFVLVLVATALAAVTPFVSLHLGYRAFDLDPRLVRLETMMTLPFFFVLMLPIILLILVLIRGRNLRPSFRSLIVLAPVLVLCGPRWVEAAFDPADPRIPFFKGMNAQLPKDAADFKAWFSHAPGETKYMFSFRCSPESTDTLLASAPYKAVENPTMLDPDFSRFYQLPIGGLTVPRGWPEPKTWSGLKVHQSEVSGGYRYLMTDESRTQVFILVGDT